MCHCVDFCFNATFPFLLFIPCELLRCVLTRFLLFEDWDHHMASGGSADCKIYFGATRLTGRPLHIYLATRCIYAYMRTRGLLFEKYWVKVTSSPVSMSQTKAFMLQLKYIYCMQVTCVWSSVFNVPKIRRQSNCRRDIENACHCACLISHTI